MLVRISYSAVAVRFHSNRQKSRIRESDGLASWRLLGLCRCRRRGLGWFRVQLPPTRPCHRERFLRRACRAQVFASTSRISVAMQPWITVRNIENGRREPIPLTIHALSCCSDTNKLVRGIARARFCVAVRLPELRLYHVQEGDRLRQVERLGERSATKPNEQNTIKPLSATRHSLRCPLH